MKSTCKLISGNKTVTKAALIYVLRKYLVSRRSVAGVVANSLFMQSLVLNGIPAIPELTHLVKGNHDERIRRSIHQLLVAVIWFDNEFFYFIYI